MAIEFHSKLTEEQKTQLQSFVNEELPKATRQKTRLDHLQTRTDAYLGKLSVLQTDTGYLYKEQQTKTYLEVQKADFPTPRSPNAVPSGFTDPSVSEAVDRVKNPLIEAVKGRFERLEYMIRRAYDRAEVLSQRSAARATLSEDLSKAMQDITTTAAP